VCNNLAALPTGAQWRSFFLGNFGGARLVCGGRRNDGTPNDPAHSPPKEPNARKRRDKDIQT